MLLVKCYDFQFNFILSAGRKDHYSVYVFRRKNPRRGAFLNSIQEAVALNVFVLSCLYCAIYLGAEVFVIKKLSSP